MLQIIAVAAFAVDTAPVAAHTVALVGKDRDAVVHLLDTFLAEGWVVDSLPDMADRAAVVVDKAVAVVGNSVVAVVVARMNVPKRSRFHS